MPTLVKICGLSSPETVEAAIGAGADFVGFVFFPASPRHIGLEHAKALGALARDRAGIVALSVDADDAALDEIVAALRPDLLQLHGHETPERVAAVKKRSGLPVIKALHLPLSESALADKISATAPLNRVIIDITVTDHDPKQAATIDLLSDGRFELGLGAGWMTTDYAQAGIPLDSAGTRIEGQILQHAPLA